MSKKFEPRAIRSNKQYEEYLKITDRLMDGDPSPSSPEGQLLETLVILIEDYENRRGWDIPVPKNPVEVIKMRMETLGLKQSDLVEAIGDKAVVSKILKGTRKLTYDMVYPLSKILLVPPEYLLERSAA